jgi:DNA-binding NtrC family response regulator
VKAQNLSRCRVLLIEDDPTLGPAMLQRLRLEGFDPRLVVDGASALREAAARPPDIVLSDMRLPDVSGEEIFRAMSARLGLMPYYFMTAFGEVQQAVRLVKAGARDYMIKPVDVDALIETLLQLTLAAPPPATPSGLPVPDTDLPSSPAMQRFELALAKGARTRLPLLVLGETGVGKERAARQAHGMSAWSGGPFVPVNCAAIPRDLAESLLFGHEKGAFTGAQARMQGMVAEADGGTLFLDEVAEMPLDLQPKLLRLLQERTFRPIGAAAERTFSGRVIAATHRDLKGRVGEGLFREDLYFRLAVIELTIPPLRARLDEILPLAGRILAECAPDGVSLDEAASAWLTRHDWPGNIRELRNRIERAVALRDGDCLGPADLFPDLDHVVPAIDRLQPHDAGLSLDAAAEAAIRQRIRETLKTTGGNQSQAARLLGVSRTTIWKYARDETATADI